MPDTIFKNKLTVTVGGRRYTGFRSFTVTRSLNDCASSFIFPGVPVDPATGEDFPIRVFDKVVVLLDGVPALTGTVEQIDLFWSPTDSIVYNVSGRSKTGVLVDCSTTPRMYSYATPLQVIGQVLAPFGVGVLPKIPLATMMESFEVGDNDTAFSVVDRLAQEHGFLVTDDALGNLILTSAAMATPGGAWIEGAPDGVVNLNHSLNGNERFGLYIANSEYRDPNTKQMMFFTGVSRDSSVPPSRVLRVQAEEWSNAAQCKVRAQWESANRVARSVNVSASVVGWGPSPGVLWEPNTLVKIYYPSIGLDGVFLVNSVTFGYSADESAKADLSLSSPAGYAPLDMDTAPPATIATTAPSRVWLTAADIQKNG